MASQTTSADKTAATSSTPPTPAAYPFSTVEPKWQEYWDTQETFKTPIRSPTKPKKYVLDMFPYPSGIPVVLDCMSDIRKDTQPVMSWLVIIE